MAKRIKETEKSRAALKLTENGSRKLYERVALSARDAMIKNMQGKEKDFWVF